MTKLIDQKRQGDKENSKFFEKFLPKIYDRKEKSGLQQNIKQIRGITIQVSPHEANRYMAELYLMTPYRFKKGYLTSTHKVYVLQIKPEYPTFFILEPLSENYYDDFTAIDTLYPRAAEKANARYIGEIFQCENSAEARKILTNEEFRFQTEIKNDFLRNNNLHFTQISYFTNNVTGYTDLDLTDPNQLKIGEEFKLTEEEKTKLHQADEVHHHFGLNELVEGIDHLATRVLCNDREDALLEFLSLSNYYFWGGYNIEDMNSSTNICRNPNINYELHSPAKVFTANNTPFYVKSIEGLPSPTEDFVRNFGRRMHHIAYEVQDGQREDGTKNIDYVVGKLMSTDIKFLAQIIGECKDFPDLKQIFSKSSEYSLLITEYVQRCQGYEGFFSKENVAYLTQAAGEDEKLKDSVKD